MAIWTSFGLLISLVVRVLVHRRSSNQPANRVLNTNRTVTGGDEQYHSSVAIAESLCRQYLSNLQAVKANAPGLDRKAIHMGYFLN